MTDVNLLPPPRVTRVAVAAVFPDNYLLESDVHAYFEKLLLDLSELEKQIE